MSPAELEAIKERAAKWRDNYVLGFSSIQDDRRALLAHVELLEAERDDLKTRDKAHEINIETVCRARDAWEETAQNEAQASIDSSDRYRLAEAERDRLRVALQVIASFGSQTNPGPSHLMRDIAERALAGGTPADLAGRGGSL